MLRLLALAGALGVMCWPGLAVAGKLVEPHMRLAPGTAHEVALTLDACTGAVDDRILNELIRDQVPATIFVTGRWLRGNAPTIRVLLAHPELFEIEDHGAQHIPAVIGSQLVYGLRPAGTEAAVIAEVAGGAAAMKADGFVPPKFYRDATALYSPDALKLIAKLGYQIGGFSLNADLGASVNAKTAAKRLEAASDGDVIIAHINQPHRSAGAGIAAGIAVLKAKGFHFVRLEDAKEVAI